MRRPKANVVSRPRSVNSPSKLPTTVRPPYNQPRVCSQGTCTNNGAHLEGRIRDVLWSLGPPPFDDSEGTGIGPLEGASFVGIHRRRSTRPRTAGCLRPPISVARAFVLLQDISDCKMGWNGLGRGTMSEEDLDVLEDEVWWIERPDPVGGQVGRCFWR